MAEQGSLVTKVLEYSDTIRRIVPNVRTAADWDPVADMLNLDEFERIGTFLEVQDWSQYVEMLTAWASGVDRFETEVHRISEVDNLVYYEIEERHFIGDTMMVLNSLTVFAFDESGKILRLDVFMQKAP